MAVPRRRSPIALRIGRARRRALTRPAHLARSVQATSSLIAEALAPAPLPVGATYGASFPASGAVPDAIIRPLPLGDVPPPDEGVPAGRLPRCAFRRLDIVQLADARAGASTYSVVCLYLDAAEPTPIGDLEAAVGACGACTYPGIFRPDAA